MPRVWEDFQWVEEALHSTERQIEEVERQMMRNVSRLNDIARIEPLEILSNVPVSRSEARKDVSLPSEGSGLDTGVKCTRRSDICSQIPLDTPISKW